MSTQSLATKALHAGHDTTTNGNTRAVPIYQSSSYVFKDADHAANLFNLSEEGFIYTRINNPTNDILEKRSHNNFGAAEDLRGRQRLLSCTIHGFILLRAARPWSHGTPCGFIPLYALYGRPIGALTSE